MGKSFSMEKHRMSLAEIDSHSYSYRLKKKIPKNLKQILNILV